MGIPSYSPDRIEVGNDRRDHFYLPGHTKENPLTRVESLREAISEAYHLNWTRHSDARNKDQKDKDADTKLSRSRKNYQK